MGKIALIAASTEMQEYAKDIKAGLKDAEELDVFGVTMKEAVSLARSLDEENYDVIIARGETARLISEAHLNIPLVEIRISNEEVMASIQMARELRKDKPLKMAFLVSSQLYHDLKPFLDIMDITFIYQEITSKNDVKVFLNKFRR